MTLDLSTRERQDFSQNGEDGVIEALFDLLGTTNRHCLEFGSHPQECNTRLLHEQGWTALCWDLTDYEVPWFGVEMVTPSSVNALLAKYEVPHDLDFLSIDVDSNDFHIWHAMDPAFRPRVVCIEHNSALGLSDQVVPMSDLVQWDGTNYFGASLTAMANLGTKRGYTLVYVERTGVNAFFVRSEELAPDAIVSQGNVAALYRPPAYGNFGHPPDPWRRPYQSSWDYLRFPYKAAEG